MNICFVQYDVSKNREDNIKKVIQLLKNINANIIVLPELADCGYLFNDKNELLQNYNTINKNEFINTLKLLSKEKNCGIISGVAEKVNGDIFNTAIILENGDILGKYRKIHLTDYEKTLFNSGKENKTFYLQGIKVGVQICFDSWFPEISREQVLNGANLLCVLGNFGSKTTTEICKIRSIENLIPLILCNRIGNEENNIMKAEFLGRSLITDGYGNILVTANDFKEEVHIASIDITKYKSNVICKDFISEINFHYKKR